MTLSAALPGAALRVMRTAAGRRALQVVLLVGGLFALGFLCGEQAHAADGVVPTTPAQVVGSVKSAVGQTGEPGSAAPKAVTDTARRIGRPVGDLVVPQAADSVVRPVGDLVKTVTGGLAEAPPEVLPSLPGLPALPGAGAPTSPAPPAASAPQPSSAVTEQPSATVARDAGRRPDISATPAAYGPSGPGVDIGDGVAVRRDHGGVRAGQSPAHQAPPGDPTGALGDRSAVGDGAPRHGDPHAVTSDRRAPLRLAPGASAVMTAAETRDRYRDIPVFPG
ncbi:hypothetical protein [Streptomyces lutosisoli]|uniref:Secreted protein n=1 Tax=Streptomyces lutosisoli TaxID=2665721 RepID=A0ABW2VBG9_9ACTN